MGTGRILVNRQGHREQIIAFLSFQIRVAAGLRVLATA
jgi:hypothetical protein